MSHHPLLPAKAKIDRAAALWKQLDAEADTVFAAEVDTVQFWDAGTREWVVRLTKAAEIPMEWSVLIGEFAHNLRASLNYIAWELAFLDTGGRMPGRQAQFPIAPIEDWAKRRIQEQVAGLSPKHLDLVESVQTREGQFNALRLLADLNNDDKHSFMQPVIINGNSIHYTIARIENCAKDKSLPVKTAHHNVHVGSDLLRIPLRAHGNRIPHLQVLTQISYYPMLRDGSSFGSLRAIHEGVEAILMAV